MAARTNRNKLYQLLAIGKSKVGICEDDYRALLMRNGATMANGRVSATTMNIGQMNGALDELKELGFKIGYGAKIQHKDWQTQMMKKIAALWFAGHSAGVIRNASKEAMLKWLFKTTGKPAVSWCTPDDLSDCIEALKDWLRREGVKERRGLFGEQQQ